MVSRTRVVDSKKTDGTTLKKAPATATIETPEPASVSAFLAKFEKPHNVALMPDKSLSQKKRMSPPFSSSSAEEGRSGSSPEVTDATPEVTTTTAAPEVNATPPKVTTATTSTTEAGNPTSCIHLNGSSVPSSAYAKERAVKPLRICCFGSSSSHTPESYLRSAAEVGYLLGVRGHTCVNGAGSFGCMAAMNEGAAAGNGHIVGVIHRMWLVDGSDMASEWGNAKQLRDGGAHAVFTEKDAGKNGSASHDTGLNQFHGGPHPALKKSDNPDGPIREMLVADGKDLQQRKRLLVEGAQALIVLPGGPGTWDELWEMACARKIGLTKLPIVCVNIDGFYDPFREMLYRAWKDKLCPMVPEDIMHFCDTAEEAVRWAEEVQTVDSPTVVLKRRMNKKIPMRSESVDSVIRSPMDFERRSSSTLSTINERNSKLTKLPTQWARLSVAVCTGIAVGILFSESRRRK